jgi:predicted transcriptional regulator
MTTSVVTARLPEEMVGRLDELASRMDRSRSWILLAAVKAYVEEQTAFLDFVDEGERDIDEGRYHTKGEMDAWFDERIAAAQARMKRAKAA